MNTKNNIITSKRMPPDYKTQNIQYELFTNFVTNNEEGVSNTVELWERIPKFFFTAAKVKKLRNADGSAKPYTFNYNYNNLPCRVEIHPAMISSDDGNFTAHFPGVTEELVEEVIKKIFAYQSQGIHDPIKNESWVKFSLAYIHKELKKNGRERNLSEIKKAIDVMSKTIIVLYQENVEKWRGAILQDLITVDRKKYLENTSAQHIARLPVFITNAINKLEYRQFNYERYMLCDEQLARWIYKQMINRFVQAEIMLPYKLLFSNIKRDSGFLQQSTDNNNRKKVILAFKELHQKNVIDSYSAKAKKEGKKIVDITYTLFPTESFAKEQRAANKRLKISKDKI